MMGWFILGFAAAHLFWAALMTLWYWRITRTFGKQGREALNANFKDVREAIRQRMAPRN